MIIQDWIMLFVSISFVFGMIPQIKMNYNIKMVKMSWITLILSGAGLFVMGGTLFTLGMVISPIINIINGFLWLFMAFQKYRYNKLEIDKLKED